MKVLCGKVESKKPTRNPILPPNTWRVTPRRAQWHPGNRKLLSAGEVLETELTYALTSLTPEGLLPGVWCGVINGLIKKLVQPVNCGNTWKDWKLQPGGNTSKVEENIQKNYKHASGLKTWLHKVFWQRNLQNFNNDLFSTLTHGKLTVYIILRGLGWVVGP